MELMERHPDPTPGAGGLTYTRAHDELNLSRFILVDIPKLTSLQRRGGDTLGIDDLPGVGAVPQSKVCGTVGAYPHALVILDQAGCHMSSKLDIPGNFTLMPLLPRSPELNPVENIWQIRRDHRLTNRVFKFYEEIVALCCEAWNKLIERPRKIIFIGMRKWAHGF